MARLPVVIAHENGHTFDDEILMDCYHGRFKHYLIAVQTAFSGVWSKSKENRCLCSMYCTPVS